MWPRAELPWHEHEALLAANLPALLADRQQGAVVSLSPTRLALHMRGTSFPKRLILLPHPA